MSYVFGIVVATLFLLFPQNSFAVTYDASCESFSAPATVKAGDPVVISAKYKNTGTAVWTLADSREQQNGIKLGSLDRLIGPSNWYPGRIINPITTGQTVTFSFTARAPMVPGFYRGPHTSGTAPVFGWKLVDEGVQWFGEACGADITVQPSSLGSINSIDTGGLVTGVASDP